MVMASEVGVYDTDPENVALKVSGFLENICILRTLIDGMNLSNFCRVV